MADLYVYFYELGVRVLKPGGLLSFIVTNKWMKSSYGEPLRRFFGENAWVESVVDFGHAKQIFEDADVFPSIIVARKPTEHLRPKTARLCTIPREQLRIDDLSRQIETEGVKLPIEQLGADAWQLEATEVTDLLAKVVTSGVSLKEFTKAEPLLGIKTGLNDAFLIDTDQKNALVAADPQCAQLIVPYIRGQDIERWHPNWAGLWMIALKSSGDYPWLWAKAGADAESVFARTFPSVYGHLKPMEVALKKRQDKGVYWWELRSCAYWERFDSPKIVYQDITWRAQFCLDQNGTLSNNTTYILPTDDLWVLAVLNSPIGWWYSWRTAVHGKDEALRFFKVLLEQFPIPMPSDQSRRATEQAVRRAIEITHSRQETCRTILDWLRLEYEVEKPSLKLQSVVELDSDSFAAEVRKVRGKRNPLSASALKTLRDEHCRSIEPARALAAELLALERQISDLVNAAYGLTADEVALMWQTAPPRMPF
jgi:hypothetical protein